jgi:hypothetical protein
VPKRVARAPGRQPLPRRLTLTLPTTTTTTTTSTTTEAKMEQRYPHPWEPRQRRAQSQQAPYQQQQQQPNNSRTQAQEAPQGQKEKLITALEALRALQDLAEPRKRAQALELGAVIAGSLVNQGDLTKTVTEAITKALRPTKLATAIQQQQQQQQPQAKTFAQALGTGPTGLEKPVNNRLNTQILVKPGALPPSLANRTPEQVVQAVRTASGTQAVTGIRQLPSGGLILALKNQKEKSQLEKTPGWIQQAFGPQATIAKPTYAILLKGLRAPDLQGATEASLKQDIQQTLGSIDRVKIWSPRDPTMTRVKVLAAFTSLEEAKKACDEGLTWKYRHLDCEPFVEEARAKQCYRCWNWGHTQKYCKKEACCGTCGTAQHLAQGQACTRAPHCPNCGLSHTARARECRASKTAYEKAKRAFQSRPKTYAKNNNNNNNNNSASQQAHTQGPTPAQAPPQAPALALAQALSQALPQAQDPEWNVGRPRKRGRPTAMAIAAEKTSQQSIRSLFKPTNLLESNLFANVNNEPPIFLGNSQPSHGAAQGPSKEPTQELRQQQSQQLSQQPNPEPTVEAMDIETPDNATTPQEAL